MWPTEAYDGTDIPCSSRRLAALPSPGRGAEAPGRPNVVGVLDGRAKGRTLMICGHTDTVGVAGMHDPFVPTERDGRLYGRGAQDMKGGVAAMIAAAGAVARKGLAAGRLVVAAVVDEEHSSIGADALVKTWHADGARTATQRAHTIWKQILADAVPPALDPPILEALDAFVARRKREITAG